MKTIFKVGDRVRYGDFEGVLYSNRSETYPLILRGKDWQVSFTPEGRDDLRSPIMLTLIESAKVKTVRRFYVWARGDKANLSIGYLEMLNDDFQNFKGKKVLQNTKYTYHKTNTYVDIEVEW